MNTRWITGRNALFAEITLANYADVIHEAHGLLPRRDVRRMSVTGMVDPTAARLRVPLYIVQHLALQNDNEIGVIYANGRTERRSLVRNVWLNLCGRASNFTVIVEPDLQHVIIGAIVLEELDLIVDCKGNEIRPRDPNGIISEIELFNV